MTPLSPLRSSYLLLNVGGWLAFGVAMMIGWLDVYPWEVVLATTPVYILIGFLLSLLLGLVYDRLGVGPASFGRALNQITEIPSVDEWNVTDTTVVIISCCRRSSGKSGDISDPNVANA